MNKKTKIILVLIIALLVLGYWGGRYLWGWYQVRQLLKIHETELALLKSDAIGGNTPEQTWQMFLEALRDEDLDLASKYFVLKRQEEWREALAKIKDAGVLETMINALSTAEIEQMGKNIAQFKYKDIDNVSRSILFETNINHKWKIRSF